MVAFRSLFVTSTDTTSSPVSTRRRYFGKLFSFTRLSSNNSKESSSGSGGRNNFPRGRSTKASSGRRGIWSLSRSQNSEPTSPNSDSEKGLEGYSPGSTFVGKDDSHKVTTVVEGPTSSTLSSPKPSHWTGRSILVSQGMTVDEEDPNYPDRWEVERKAAPSATSVEKETK
jgi:hypothetical protein